METTVKAVAAASDATPSDETADAVDTAPLPASVAVAPAETEATPESWPNEAAPSEVADEAEAAAAPSEDAAVPPDAEADAVQEETSLAVSDDVVVTADSEETKDDSFSDEADETKAVASSTDPESATSEPAAS
jgi:hypothetical protein